MVCKTFIVMLINSAKNVKFKITKGFLCSILSNQIKCILTKGNLIILSRVFGSQRFHY